MEEKFKLEIENTITELNKIKILIDDVIANNNKLITDIDSAEKTLLATIAFRELEDIKDIIDNLSYEDLMCDSYNEVSRKNDKLADEYIKNILK